MNPNASELDIQKIKLKIKELKEGIARRNALQKKREELEKFLLETQLKAHHTLLKAHQRQAEDELKLYSKAHEYDELGKELLHKLTLVDKEIDKWEDIDETAIYKLQTELAACILKHNPDQQKELDDLKNVQHKWALIQQQNNRLLALLSNLEHLITTIQITRKRIKRQGILSYIFGSSPTQMIAQCLQGIITVLNDEKATIAAIQENSPTKEMKDALSELADYSNELAKDCQMRWSYRHLDKLIEKNFMKIQDLKSKFEIFQVLIEAELEKSEQELQKWLSQY